MVVLRGGVGLVLPALAVELVHVLQAHAREGRDVGPEGYDPPDLSGLGKFGVLGAALAAGLENVLRGSVPKPNAMLML